MDYQLELKLHFDLIASLWRERGEREFVSRAELHDKLVPDLKPSNEVVTQWMHGGIDLALDAFAKTGPNFDAFKEMLIEYTEPKGFYWRYQVTRDGRDGYVRREHLTEKERDEITSRLRREGEQAIREADEILKPRFLQ